MWPATLPVFDSVVVGAAAGGVGDATGHSIIPANAGAASTSVSTKAALRVRKFFMLFS